MSKSHFSQAGNKIHGALHNSGNFFQGKIEGGVVINQIGDKFGAANNEVECEKALFLTNPVDDRSGVETSKEPLVPKACQWIHEQPTFQSWFNNDMDSQLLWISGGSGRGKTMLSLFLLQEIEKSAVHMQNGQAVVLFYFVDTRSAKRNTAVSILRGLIWLLVKARPRLMSLLLSEFVIQGRDLFTQTSLEGLWRIFAEMLKDPGTGKVYCIIDGLDECQEDSLQPFLRKVTKFFNDEREYMEQWRQGNLNPRLTPKFAWVRMILVSREAPQCLLDNLAGKFPWIQIEKATKGTTTKQKSTQLTAKSGEMTAKPVVQKKKATAKLSTIALLALQKKRLASAQSDTPDPAKGDASVVEQQLTKLSIEGNADTTAPERETAELSSNTTVIPPVELATDDGTQSHHIADGTAGDGYEFDDVVEDDEIIEEETTEVQKESDGAEEEEEVPQNQALSYYIDAKMEELAQGRSYGEALESSVASGLQQKGDGTFLWVDLAIEELRLYDAQYVEQIVQQLPPSVSEMYCRTLRRIPEHTVSLVVAIFHWVIAAHRPLFVPELSTALMQMGFTTTNPVEMVKQGVAACNTMLTINEETSEVKIKHTSVQDFLIDKSGPLWTDAALHRFHINVEDVDSNIATICLRYLEQGCLKDGPVTMADGVLYWQRVSQFPLLPYAAVFWPEHLRTASRPYIDPASPFFAKKSAIRKNWWQCYFPATTGKLAILAPRDFTLLHMAAYLNLPFVAQHLEYRGELHPRLNSKDSHGSTPLYWAAVQGNMEMFVFLLQRGASKDCIGESIFDVACRKGQADIVEYLLNMGQDPNARMVEVNSFVALGQTARWAHGLLNEGTKLDNDYWKLFIKDIGTQGTAMHWACLFGHSAVVQLLINRGGSVHMSTNKGWTAIHSASWTGQMDCIKLLLDHGADPQGITHDGWNALHCAASRGKHPAVTFYLAYGLPVDVLTAKRKTPLHLASYTGNAATIRVLVGAGAFIDAQSYKGETPLHLAARSGEPEAVETLLSLGANKYMVNNGGLPPAESLKAIRTGLTVNQKEALRVLEQYGMPGYVPWQPKVDPNAAANQQQPASQQGAGQFSQPASGFEQQSAPTFTADFQFSGATMYCPEEKPHVQRSETFPLVSHPTPGLDRRFSNAAPPPPYSPSPAFPQQGYPQEKGPQPVPAIAEQPPLTPGAPTENPAPFVPIPRRPSFNSLSGTAAAQGTLSTAPPPQYTGTAVATPPQMAAGPSSAASSHPQPVAPVLSALSQSQWGSTSAVLPQQAPAASPPAVQTPALPMTPASTGTMMHPAQALNTPQPSPPAPAVNQTQWSNQGVRHPFQPVQPTQQPAFQAPGPPGGSSPVINLGHGTTPQFSPQAANPAVPPQVQPAWNSPVPTGQPGYGGHSVRAPVPVTSTAPPMTPPQNGAHQAQTQGAPHLVGLPGPQPTPIPPPQQQQAWSHPAAAIQQPQPQTQQGILGAPPFHAQTPHVQSPHSSGGPPQYGQPAPQAYPVHAETRPQWQDPQPSHSATQSQLSAQPWAPPQPPAKPYSAPAPQPWAPPAVQPAPTPHLPPQQTGYTSAPSPQWAPPTPTPVPSYTSGAYPSSPLQQQAPAYPQTPQQTPGYHQPQQQFSPYQQAGQYQQPGAPYQPPQTTTTGYLSVTGYVPGWVGRPQGVGGGMDFAPPPGMGGPLPHPGEGKKKSLFSLGGIEITRK